MSTDADRLNEIRVMSERPHRHLPDGSYCAVGQEREMATALSDLLAALDAAKQRAKLLEQRIERQRIELAGANDRNRRGNEFARRQAEQERDEALRRYAIKCGIDVDGGVPDEDLRRAKEFVRGQGWLANLAAEEKP